MIKLMNSGYSGILPGWTQGDMVDLIAKCENEGKGDYEVVMDWAYKHGNDKQTTTTIGKLRHMCNCTNSIRTITLMKRPQNPLILVKH